MICYLSSIHPPEKAPIEANYPTRQRLHALPVFRPAFRRSTWASTMNPPKCMLRRALYHSSRRLDVQKNFFQMVFLSCDGFTYYSLDTTWSQATIENIFRTYMCTAPIFVRKFIRCGGAILQPRLHAENHMRSRKTCLHPANSTFDVQVRTTRTNHL